MQTQFMGQYRDIIGLNAVLRNMMGNGSREQRVSNIWGGLKNVMGISSKSPYGMFSNIEDSGNATLDRIYREMRLQFSDYPKLPMAGLNSSVAPDAIHHFGVGMRSVPIFHENYGNQVRQFQTGKSFMTFDIETAGLMKNQIREVSFATGQIGSGGFNTTARSSEYFEPRLFGRGSMGIKDTDGRIIPARLTDFMHSKFGIGPGRSSDEFADRMIPFLEQLNKVDYVIGHNIGGFDIEQIFTQLAGSKKYASDSQFRALVDQSFDAVKPGSGKIMDTLQLARTAPNLAGIQLAPELERIGRGGPYSVENLLLQTDLSERIGLGNVRKMLGSQGLHMGNVDLEITNQIAQHLNDLVPKALGGSAIENSIRRSVLSSAAITPSTLIRSQGDIADTVLRTMIETGTGIEGGDKRLNHLLKKAQGGDTIATQKAYERIRAGRHPNLRFGINPVEHDILATRNLGISANVSRGISPDDLAMNAGAFGRATGVSNQLYKGQAVKAFQDARILSGGEMAGFQNDLLARGMPFAGLSFEERRLGTTLASITSSVPGHTFDADMGIVGNDIMVSNFGSFDPARVGYNTATGRSSMPASLLERAGILSDGSSSPVSMLGMSIVEPTEQYPHRSVNLVYNFRDQSQLEGFAQSLEQLQSGSAEDIAEALGYGREGFPTAAVSHFREALGDGLIEKIRTEGMARGVSIGQIGGQAADQVNDILKEVSGLDQLADNQMMAFRLPFMKMDIDEATGMGVVRTAGAVLDRGLGSQGLDLVGKAVQHTQNVYEAFKVLSRDSGKMTNAKSIAGAVDGSQISKVISGYNMIQDHIRPNIGKVALGALAVGIGSHLWNKHEEAKKYDATAAPMPTDRRRYAAADELQARIESGYNGYYQSMDPMATMALPDILRQNSIGHTNMDPNRYSSLYSGALG